MIAFLETIQNARARARMLLEDYPKAVSKTGSIDVNYLAEQLDIKIEREKFEDKNIAGFIKMKTNDGKSLIVLNEDNAAVRQRFTIAHEIGHYLLHPNQSVYIDDRDTAELVHYRNEASSQAIHLREIEANQFGSELLMPENLIQTDVSALRLDGLGMSEIVESLSEKYAVSQSAMTIRLNRST